MRSLRRSWQHRREDAPSLLRLLLLLVGALRAAAAPGARARAGLRLVLLLLRVALARPRPAALPVLRPDIEIGPTCCFRKIETTVLKFQNSYEVLYTSKCDAVLTKCCSNQMPCQPKIHAPRLLPGRCNGSFVELVELDQRGPCDRGSGSASATASGAYRRGPATASATGSGRARDPSPLEPRAAGRWLHCGLNHPKQILNGSLDLRNPQTLMKL